MTTRIYRASRTQSNSRPGWSVTFSHPLRTDARGKSGLKMRRGLGTTDGEEAQRLVDQLNELLSDQSWWSPDRRGDAGRQFDSRIVAAFFNEMEIGKVDSRQLRQEIMRLPDPTQGYARIMLVGSTGAGKTTLLRQLIGSDHRRDRFPATSTAKTTTAETEVVADPTAEHYDAVITFKTEYEIRCAVEECIEDACLAVIRDHDDARIAAELLEHREQRFRLSHLLGNWPEPVADAGLTSMFDEDWDNDDGLPVGETVTDEAQLVNNERLAAYVSQIREIATATRDQLVPKYGAYEEIANPYRLEEWREDFIDSLYDSEDYRDLSLDIMDVIKGRFDAVSEGTFECTAAGWPNLWQYRLPKNDRVAFLRQVRWFTSNHGDQFGRLLTPLVDGIRVKGPFKPLVDGLGDDEHHLVFLDGEGLGHSAKEATSVSTKVTERFPDVEMILLVDDAQSPMQAASLELLRSTGSSGHEHKIAVAFTHFDQVDGDNLRNNTQKVNHVVASVNNAILSLRDSLGGPTASRLERQLENSKFYLGKLDMRVPEGFTRQLSALLDRMQASAVIPEPPIAAPIYSVARLDMTLRDATDNFKNPWKGRLGLVNYEGGWEHWTRVKALCRRIANRWDNEYNGLRPVADLVRELQNAVSLWLNNPSGWTRHPQDDDEREAAISKIKRDVFVRMHMLAERRLVTNQRPGWETAFSAFRGTGSSRRRAMRIVQIYEEAAPSISYAMDTDNQELFDEVIGIVRDAVEAAGGSMEGANYRETIGVA